VGEAAFQEPFRQARQVARRLVGRGLPKSLSYQAFIKLLVRWTVRLLACLVPALRSRMERKFPDPFRIAGFVTSVRDAGRLSDRQVANSYRQRWGIELFFRHFQQTLGRSKLRSHKAEHSEWELH
jgi:IS4 transposase